MVKKKTYIMGNDILLTEAEKFHGVHSPGLSLEGFNAHNKWLQVYARLHNCKQSNWKSLTFAQ